MAKIARYFSAPFAVFAATVVRTFIFVGPALAACGDEAKVRCHPDFETLQAVARSGDGFTAVGILRGASRKGAALLRLTSTGAARGSIFNIPLPATPHAPTSITLAKLLALPNGDVVLLGDIAVGDDKTERKMAWAWAARIAPNDRVVWNRIYPDGANLTLFHSGLYEATGERIILVGRRSSGSDDYSCENWSQSWVMPVSAANGQLLSPITLNVFGETGKSPTNRQAIYDITPAESTGTYLVTGFLTRRAEGLNAECQDNLLIGTLTQGNNNRWALSSVQSIGLSNWHELGYAIRPAGGGTYMVATHGRDDRVGAPAAQVYWVRAQPFAVRDRLSTPYPSDGSDKWGVDRFRVLVPFAGNTRFLAAGSVATANTAAARRGLWQVFAADMRFKDEAHVFRSPGGSEVFDALLTPDQKVLAVGRWTDEGREVGWFGFIGDTGPPVAQLPSNRSLPSFSDLPESEGVRQLPSAAFSTGVGYLERDWPADKRMQLALSVPAAARPLKVAALAASGDVDMVIVDAEKRPVAFTNFKGSAKELMIATLPPGRYLLTIVAQSRVPSFEFRLGPFAGPDAQVMAKLDGLSFQQRQRFAADLVLGGYTAPSNPDIALGSESVRAFLAIQESVNTAIEPRDIGKYVSP